MEKFDPIQVVIGIVQGDHEQFLVTQRQSHQWLPGLWEFPGGKQEPGETLFQTLQRELQEEVGIHVTKATAFLTLEGAQKAKPLCLSVWWVHEFTGEPEGREGQSLQWVTLDVLATLPVPKPNECLVAEIRSHLSKGKSH